MKHWMCYLFDLLRVICNRNYGHWHARFAELELLTRTDLSGNNAGWHHHLISWLRFQSCGITTCRCQYLKPSAAGIRKMAKRSL